MTKKYLNTNVLTVTFITQNGQGNVQTVEHGAQSKKMTRFIKVQLRKCFRVK